jgi:hypothetical protein
MPKMVPDVEKVVLKSLVLSLIERLGFEMQISGLHAQL